MKLAVNVVQFVSEDGRVKQNLERILDLTKNVERGQVIVFPEGALSGYSDDLDFLDKINDRRA
ncbi:hypothetical protein [Peribacillus deserti]|uniref:CN hydrolase domain-containing protein n=1 Tax=Peribacillus deserti TaxID=673318 RepID=A0A2N5M9M8_9BACI|nr:hypothetical protein [Peribacillus deserti]PLT31033.1 hypothetical protein CUU66_04300 [Peribacillus deserti]